MDVVVNWLKNNNASVNSSCTQPPPPHPGLLRGMPFQSQEWGICKFCAARGPSIQCQPRGYSRAFDTHAVSYQNITIQRILLKKKSTLAVKLVSCKGMFSMLCMHFFIAYQARITKGNSVAIDVNQGFLVTESISADIIWRTSFHNI